MPTYEFNCRSCGNRFETLVSAVDKDKVRCPVCRSNILKEVYGINVQTAKDSCSSKPFRFG
jgi:putative FmdB family regulatory protein